MKYDWFSFWNDINPDSIAITIPEEDRSYTYGDIHQKGNEVASVLYTKYEIRKGDRVAVLSKNGIEYIYLLAAAQKLGFIIVPLNYRLTPHELGQLITNAEPKIIINNEDHPLDEKNIITFDSIIHDENTIDFDTEIMEDDPLFIMYTSGSTGIPKGAIYTYKMCFWNSVNTSISLGINSNTCALVCMPLFHTGGWNVLLTPLLHHGGRVVLTQRFEAEDIVEYLAKYACDQFIAVPTMLKMISETTIFTQVELPSLPYIIVGGESMPVPLIKTYAQKGIAIRQGFGMTEVGPNLTSLHQNHSLTKIGSIGKPNMYVDVKIIHETGRDCHAGELGELCFRGPVVTPGYWRRESASRDSIVDGWFHSGDIAMRDVDGFIYIKDRKKNMYISGGENVYPAEIEKVLLSYPAITAAVVVGVADDKWGEVGKAFLVAETDVSVEDIKTYLKSKLSKYKIPKHFCFLESMPVGPTGKIDKAAILRMS